MRALLYLKVNVDWLVAEHLFHRKSDDVTVLSFSCLAAYFLLQGLQAGWLRDYSYRCQPVDYSNNPLALRVRIRTIYIATFGVSRIMFQTLPHTIHAISTEWIKCSIMWSSFTCTCHLANHLRNFFGILCLSNFHNIEIQEAASNLTDFPNKGLIDK
jgi:hypothetical protein